MTTEDPRAARDAAIDERVAKLPNWVGQEIGRLRREIQDRDRRLDELTPGTEGKTGVVLVDHVNGDRPLPSRANIQWSADVAGRPAADWNYIEARREDDGTIIIHGSHALVVRPWASNSIKLRLEA